MKLFNTLCIEISARCNRKCGFCPVAYNTRPNELMPLELMFKAFKELGSVKYRGRIEFYIYNEPLKEKGHLLDSVRLARKLVPKSCLMVATNGDYFKGLESIMELYNAGLNQILINCYSPGLYKKRVPWIESLPASVSRTLGVYSVNSYRSKSIEMLDKSDPDSFGSGIFRLVNRAGNIPDYIPALKTPVSRMCVKPFRLLNINWQGNVLVCCQDYHGDVSYGNLLDKTLVELWEHPVMNAYRHSLLRKDRSLPLCRSCDCHAGAYPHNVPTPGVSKVDKAEIEHLYAASVTKRVRLPVVHLGS